MIGGNYPEKERLKNGLELTLGRSDAGAPSLSGSLAAPKVDNMGSVHGRVGGLERGGWRFMGSRGEEAYSLYSCWL